MTTTEQARELAERLKSKHGDPKPTTSVLYDAAKVIHDLADQVDGRNDGERRFRKWLETNPEAKPEGTVEALAQSATMLETWGPECFPVDEHGKVHFARAMMEGVAVEIRAFLAALNAGGERG